MRAASIEIFMGPAAKGTEEKRSNVVAFPAEVGILVLTQGVARGDEAVAREFFEAFCDRLFRYTLVMVRGDEETARDVLSVTMIKAVRHMKPMGAEADLWRWLTRLARTAFIDHCRKNARRIVTVANDSGPEIPANERESDAELARALSECLAELPLEEREMMERHYLDERSQIEIAVETNSTRKAIESRLARIRQKLRAAILRKIHEH